VKKILLSLALCSSAVFAEPQALTLDEVKQKVTAAYPKYHVDTVQASKIPGFYEVLLGSEVLYVSTDARFFIQGDVVDMSAQPIPTNITEETRKNLRLAKIKGITAKDYIAFDAAKPKHRVYVFTDIDCGYCRMLHSKVKQYNDLGISIRYLAFPRQGLNSDIAKKMESVWCGDNPQALLTKAKNDEAIPEKTCPVSGVIKNPIAKDFDLGVEVGVNGTPSILLDDGSIIGGYVEPAKLIQMLDTHR